MTSYRRSNETMFIPMDIIKKYLPTSPTIVDCGAHIGIDTIELAKIPGSIVYAFEPIKELFDQLVFNTKSYKNISCFNIALNEFDGEAEMYVSSGESDGSSSLLKPKEHVVDHPNVLFDKIINVKCKKIDTWAKDNNVDQIDMLWLDMQGAEQKMLMASSKIINTVSVLHTEVSVHETYEGVESFKIYKEFLKQKGFKVVMKAIPNGYDMGNVLFVRK